MIDRGAVLIIGGGMSGLCAGLAAAEQGAEVVILEAATEPGGSMLLSGGLIWAPRDWDTARQHIPRGDPCLQALLVHHLDEGWEWLERHGIPLGPVVACMTNEIGRGRVVTLGEPGRRQPFAAALADRVRAHGGRLHMATRAVAVEGKVGNFQIRVREENTGKSFTLRAAAVVFAGGGFHNDVELLRRFITPYAESLVVRSNRHSDGLAIKAAPGLGAALSGGMYSFYGHTLPVTDRPIDPTEFIPMVQFYSHHCPIVNALGLRFADESRGLLDECNAQAGARQPDARYYVIFDEFIRRTFVSAGEGLPGVVSSMVTDRLAYLRERGGRVFSAGTLPELAAVLDVERGVPAPNVLDTLTVYNAAGSAAGAVLHPPHTHQYHPLLEPPFYAVECLPGITYTMGGLAVDDSLRVLDATSAPVGGVFSAGADAGRVFEDVYGGGLAWALVSGMVAGRSAAASV